MSRATFNSVGLAALPNEIYYEILSNMLAVQILVDTDEDNRVTHSSQFWSNSEFIFDENRIVN